MRVPLILAATLAMAACAGRPPETPSQPSMDVGSDQEASSADEPAAPAERAASSASSSSASPDRPPGDLVCRTVTTAGGAHELYLEWKGGEARGVVRETAPSGMVHEKKVRAERHQGLVVADDIHTTDLVDHAAIVAERNGKKVMKIEDTWSTCE